MKKYKLILFLLIGLIGITLTSCEKEETKVDLPLARKMITNPIISHEDLSGNWNVLNDVYSIEFRDTSLFRKIYTNNVTFGIYTLSNAKLTVIDRDNNLNVIKSTVYDSIYIINDTLYCKTFITNYTKKLWCR